MLVVPEWRPAGLNSLRKGAYRGATRNTSSRAVDCMALLRPRCLTDSNPTSRYETFAFIRWMTADEADLPIAKNLENPQAGFDGRKNDATMVIPEAQATTAD